MSFPSMGGYFMPSDPKERAKEARDTFETMYWWNPSMEGTSQTMKQMEETGNWRLGMEGFGALPEKPLEMQCVPAVFNGDAWPCPEGYDFLQLNAGCTEYGCPPPSGHCCKAGGMTAKDWGNAHHQDTQPDNKHNTKTCADGTVITADSGKVCPENKTPQPIPNTLLVVGGLMGAVVVGYLLWRKFK